MGSNPALGKRQGAIVLALLLCGCAARPPRSDRIPAEQKLWSTCVETVPVNADGFQHFTCQDFQQKKSYEVLVRLTPEVKSKKRKEEK